MERKKTKHQVLIGFFAGVLFLLAGLTEIAAYRFGSTHAKSDSGVGIMFLCIGCLWITIAAGWKKKLDAGE